MDMEPESEAQIEAPSLTSHFESPRPPLCPKAAKPKQNGSQEELFALRLEQARTIKPGWKVKSISNSSEWPKSQHPMKEHLRQVALERNHSAPILRTAQCYVNWLSVNPPRSGIASSDTTKTVVSTNPDGEIEYFDDDGEDGDLLFLFYSSEVNIYKC